MTFRIAGALIAGILVFTAGMMIASEKLLWNDELFTQVDTIDRLGFKQILAAEFPEGNLSPLFYVGQKTLAVLSGYHLPVAWKGEFCIYEPRGQRLLRVLPVACMSLAAAILFFYLSSRVSPGFACVGLLVMFSAFSFWAYMPEARPYGLWFLLTLCQGILFAEILRRGKDCSPAWWWSLAIINCLASLTIFFAAIPLIAVSAVLVLRERQRFFRRALAVTLLPLAVCAAYYFLSKRTYGALQVEPLGMLSMVRNGAAIVASGALKAQSGLLWTNFPPYWLLFIVAGVSGIGVLRFFRGPSPERPRASVNALTGLMLALGAQLLMSFGMVVWFLGWQAQGNFAVTERYFLFLSPYALLFVVFLLHDLWGRAQADGLGRGIIIAGTMAMIVLTSIGTVTRLMTWGPFWSVWRVVPG
jgi:hypothetical protein